ncbi:hypothetical protein GCM10009133_15100 [Cocleimonas flava]|uniref:Uncharacterized protein n=2 Tax=Cocleimonas flava TaxID=634765 RepID=A0A4R1EYY1_9GAMM|nr:hypothetical protein [Cocleimonas flava]TCJ84438.1 hypothetical protein EV695_2395 [Cocleimonas flava]
MYRFISLMATLTFYFVSTSVNAFEVDYNVGINNVDLNGSSTPRLVMSANFENSGLAGLGSFTIFYNVVETYSGITVFSDSLTISSEETEITVGSAKVGKITMTYDQVTDGLKTRFVMKLPPVSQYSVSASDGFWFGSSEISNNFLFN